MRIVRHEKLQTDALRGAYSDELCALLCALVTRDPSQRATLTSILSWPLLQPFRPGEMDAPIASGQPSAPVSAKVEAVRPSRAEREREAFGAEALAAAQAIQGSFRQSRHTARHDRRPLSIVRAPVTMRATDQEMQSSKPAPLQIPRVMIAKESKTP